MSYPTCLLTLQKQQIWDDLPQTTINNQQSYQRL